MHLKVSFVVVFFCQALYDGASIRTDGALRIRLNIQLAKFLRTNVVYLGKVSSMQTRKVIETKIESQCIFKFTFSIISRFHFIQKNKAKTTKTIITT